MNPYGFVVGFTGTRQGMNERQQNAVALLLDALEVDAVAHGDCVGADDQFDALATERGIKVLVYPPNIPNKRAFVNLTRRYYNRREFPEQSYKDRNQAIVNCCDVLIACPLKSAPEDDPMSGTWSTVRKAQKAKKPVVIIRPQ